MMTRISNTLSPVLLCVILQKIDIGSEYEGWNHVTVSISWFRPDVITIKFFNAMDEVRFKCYRIRSSFEEIEDNSIIQTLNTQL